MAGRRRPAMRSPRCSKRGERRAARVLYNEVRRRAAVRAAQRGHGPEPGMPKLRRVHRTSQEVKKYSNDLVRHPAAAMPAACLPAEGQVTPDLCCNRTRAHALALRFEQRGDRIAERRLPAWPTCRGPVGGRDETRPSPCRGFAVDLRPKPRPPSEPAATAESLVAALEAHVEEPGLAISTPGGSKATSCFAAPWDSSSAAGRAAWRRLLERSPCSGSSAARCGFRPWRPARACAPRPQAPS